MIRPFTIVKSCYSKVTHYADKHIQNDQDKIVKWSEKRQMLFSFGKCKCLHKEHGDMDVNYKMGDTVLGTAINKMDFIIIISVAMKVSEQCGIAVSKM